MQNNVNIFWEAVQTSLGALVLLAIAALLFLIPWLTDEGLLVKVGVLLFGVCVLGLTGWFGFAASKAGQDIFSKNSASQEPSAESE